MPEKTLDEFIGKEKERHKMPQSVEEYKETPIGRIPKEWEVTKLNTVLKLIRNGLVYKQNKEGVGYPISRIETISNEKIDPNKIGYVNSLKEEEIREYQLITGDILFSHINSVAHIGKTALYENYPELLIHGMNLLVLRSDKQKIDPYFLLYLLKLYRKVGIFKSIAKKAVNQASINQKELGKLKIPLPPLPKQKKIAEILSTVDKAIETVDTAIAQTERLKKGMMQELLSKGIGHKEFKDTKIGRIPKEWEVVRLGDIIELKSGLYFKFSEFSKDGVRCFKIDNVGFGKILWDTITFLPKNYLSIYPDLILNEGDIVMALNRPIINGKLKVGILKKEDTPSILYQRVGKIIFKNKNKLNNYYLFHVFIGRYFKQQLSRFLVGTDQPYIRNSSLLKIQIPLPPLPEQKKIAEILSTVDKKLELERERKKKLERIKKGLMNDLLTGKRRVKVDAIH